MGFGLFVYFPLRLGHAAALDADKSPQRALYNISPVDVENVLMRHLAIIECACVPVPDPSGQRSAIVKAIVVAEADVRPDDALVSELQDFVKANVPPCMYLRAIEFIDALPKTINGKIKRSELRRRS